MAFFCPSVIGRKPASAGQFKGMQLKGLYSVFRVRNLSLVIDGDGMLHENMTAITQIPQGVVKSPGSNYVLNGIFTYCESNTVALCFSNIVNWIRLMHN